MSKFHTLSRNTDSCTAQGSSKDALPLKKKHTQHHDTSTRFKDKKSETEQKERLPPQSTPTQADTSTHIELQQELKHAQGRRRLPPVSRPQRRRRRRAVRIDGVQLAPQSTCPWRGDIRLCVWKTFWGAWKKKKGVLPRTNKKKTNSSNVAPRFRTHAGPQYGARKVSQS